MRGLSSEGTPKCQGRGTEEKLILVLEEAGEEGRVPRQDIMKGNMFQEEGSYEMY